MGLSLPADHAFAESVPRGAARTGLRGSDPSPEEAQIIDRDVADGVRQMAEAVLAERVAEAAAYDPVFSEEVARRVADFTLRGGKRMRPRLLWWAMRACGAAETAAALRLGVGLELIQTCALIQDDVMDRSRTRRGRPAVHLALAERLGPAAGSGRGEAFGASAAVLAGDLALVWADDTVAETFLPPSRQRQIRALWRAMRGEMVAGQYLDLRGQADGAASAAGALRIACLKSALYSVERPMALGAALAGADERTADGLRSAGRYAGIAFQLRDDLLGVFGDPEVTGKPSGDDIREGKPTYLLAVARACAAASDDRRALAVLDRAVGDPDLGDEGLAEVRAVLESTGARAQVEDRARRLGELAAQRLAGAVDVDAHAGGRLLGLLRTVAGGRPPVPPVPVAAHPPHPEAAASSAPAAIEGGCFP
ncbi:polyprenyl synthetase family protein [Streptomyces sp. NPDC059698]|uniref:polyprenyl synthetase family protein n=1 Tax=unclassified Streptomyces TaxID=2593676 RepID=UPI00093EF52E|nr:polyprenyl synthetase family protein [Streptomyces sp. CB02366]OKJ36229.1 geranylgeranyl pyrophosphate synthase [Streptomyces sp. CB02366]TVP34520.1 geranylgeranyl pyrophosphate synthase [Streptomyces griseus subsp. griseus]WSS54493.1 polyprenyl synthetase family protein [Streptomyces sp. NBC_01178]